MLKSSSYKAFNSCSNTRHEWKRIKIQSNPECLQSCDITVVFFSAQAVRFFIWTFSSGVIPWLMIVLHDEIFRFGYSVIVLQTWSGSVLSLLGLLCHLAVFRTGRMLFIKRDMDPPSCLYLFASWVMQWRWPHAWVSWHFLVHVVTTMLIAQRETMTTPPTCNVSASLTWLLPTKLTSCRSFVAGLYTFGSSGICGDPPGDLCSTSVPSLGYFLG